MLSKKEILRWRQRQRRKRKQGSEKKESKEIGKLNNIVRELERIKDKIRRLWGEKKRKY
jgi:hypothetical protein